MRFDILLSLLFLLIGVLISLDKIKEFEKRHWGWRYIKEKKGREYLRAARSAWKLKNGMVTAWALGSYFSQHLLPEWKKRNRSTYSSISDSRPVFISEIGSFSFGSTKSDVDLLADNGFIKRGPCFELFKKWVKGIPMSPSSGTIEHWSTPEALTDLEKCIVFVTQTMIDFQGGFSLCAFLKSFNTSEASSAHLLREQLKKEIQC